MGKRSRSSSSSPSSSSSSSSSGSDKKTKKKDKKKRDKKVSKKTRLKKDKKKKDKKRKDKKKQKGKKAKKEEEAAPEIAVTCGPVPIPDAPGVKEEREKLIREAVAHGAQIAVPGNTPEVKDGQRFEQAKARLDSLRGMQQTKMAKVEYTVRKPNW
mmetsp:Transcript_36633/g.92188  ORF Transcript_36633/g.92188 Transcript_36633/m.92188 type:complete len:156 (+) Transcript_36633:115-582(+)